MNFWKKGTIISCIISAGIFFSLEKIFGEVEKKPKSIIGLNPPGAAPIIRWGARQETRLLTWLRKKIGQYVRRNDLATYNRFIKILD
jgi:hypothetical protein